MADVDAALEQKILNVAQAEREPYVHHHHEPDHLRRRVETTKRVGGHGHFTVLPAPNPACNFSLTGPGLELAGGAPSGSYDLVLLAVPHREYLAMGAAALHALVAPGGTLADLKGALNGAADWTL